MTRTKRFVALGLLIVAGWLGMSALGRGEPEKKPPPSFVKEIRPFLSRYCYECHQPDQAKKGVDVSSYRKLIDGTGKKKSKIVVPGKPDDSSLVRTLEGKAKLMPPRKYDPQPTAEEIKRVREWIAAGAPDDSPKKVEK